MVEAVDHSHRKNLISNIFSLSFLQVANYVLPLLTVPYLVRILGPEKYGLINFSQAFIQYFILLTDYGFNLSATRKIAINREDNDQISEIFSAVFIIKFVLLLISFLIMISVVLSFHRFQGDFYIFIYTFGMVVGNVLFPIWFFQGMEKMKYITYFNILWKTVFTLLIFVLVRKQADYLMVPVLNSLGYIVIGVISLNFIHRKFDVQYKLVGLKRLKEELRDGFYIFISGFATSLYTTSNAFILGLVTNNTIVGYYSAAEKIIRAVQYLNNPISQAIFPYISKLTTDSKEKSLSFIKKTTKLVGAANLLFSLMIFLLARPIVLILLGKQYTESIAVLRILALLPFIISLSNILGVQVMLNYGMEKLFSKIIVTASLLNVVLALVLSLMFKDIGVSYAVVITELMITVTMYYVLNKKGIHIF